MIDYKLKYLKYKLKYINLKKKGGASKAPNNAANDLKIIMSEINSDNIMEAHKINNIKETGLLDKHATYKINQNIEKSDLRYVLHLLAFDALTNFESLQIDKNNLIKHILSILTKKSEFYKDFFVIEFLRPKKSINIQFDLFLTSYEYGPSEEYKTEKFRNLWNEIKEIYLEMKQTMNKKLGTYIRTPVYNEFLGKTVMTDVNI